ncbi:MAG: response regulator [Chitinophagaceae bacterium]|nr:response regulator [Oligoflexus sp.]
MSKSKNYTLLVIDDELQVRRFTQVTLSPHGYDVHSAETGKQGIELSSQLNPDAIILDLGLPDMDGLEVLSTLKSWYQGPIIVLSVRDDEESIVAALDSGAHDYVRKPFHLGELLARLRLALKNNQANQTSPIYTSGDLRVDLSSRRVTLGDREIKLTVTEFELLKVLIRHRGKVLTHNQILSEVWGPKSVEHIQYLRVYVGHLRQKLENDINKPRLILTEPGVGYRLQNLDLIKEAMPIDNPSTDTMMVMSEGKLD